MQFVIEYTQAAHSLCRCPFLFHAYEVFLPNPVFTGRWCQNHWCLEMESS